MVLTIIISLSKVNLYGGDLETRLKRHVVKLSEEIGERNLSHYQNLEAAAEYITKVFQNYGYEVESQWYKVRGKTVRNIIVEKKGKKEEKIIIGAHYDSVSGSPGADDNASGVAGLLEISRLMADEDLERTIVFVAFTCEEPPFFFTRNMGSKVYARRCWSRKEKIIGMVSLEMIGFYTKEKRKRALPSRILSFLHPQVGNYVTLVGNISSKKLINRMSEGFKKHSDFPLLSVVVPELSPTAGWSDHSSFWSFGYHACMATDMAFYRNPHYHTSTDTPDILNYDSMSRVIIGLYGGVLEMAK